VKVNKIQFQKGMSLNQFLARYGNEQQCEAALEDACWPKSFRYSCCSKEHYRYKRNSVKIFHSTKLALTIWFQAQVMCDREGVTRLSGRVEVDDTFLGEEHPRGKAGRGSENKLPLIAAVKTNGQSNHLYAVYSLVKAFTGKKVAS